MVRISACHAEGRGFESRPHRQEPAFEQAFLLLSTSSVPFLHESKTRPHPARSRLPLYFDLRYFLYESPDGCTKGLLDGLHPIGGRGFAHLARVVPAQSLAPTFPGGPRLYIRARRLTVIAVGFPIASAHRIVDGWTNTVCTGISRCTRGRLAAAPSPCREDEQHNGVFFHRNAQFCDVGSMANIAEAGIFAFHLLNP